MGILDSKALQDYGNNMQLVGRRYGLLKASSFLMVEAEKNKLNIGLGPIIERISEKIVGEIREVDALLKEAMKERKEEK
jgi:hypothetical protein